MRKMNLFLVLIVLALAVVVSACAKPPVQYRHEENFTSPVPKGDVIQIGTAGDITRDGTFEKGFIRVIPLNVGEIRTLKNVTIIEEDMPIYKDQLACKNFDHMVQKTKKTTYTHEYVVEGKIVHKWDTDQPNWWAVGLTNLAGQLLNRGVDAAVIYGTGGLSEAARAATTIVNDVTAKGGKGGAGGNSTAWVENQPKIDVNATAKTKTGKITLQQQQEQQLQPPSKKSGGKKKSKKKGNDC